MKKIALKRLFIALLLLSMFVFMSSCKELIDSCGGYGTLRLTNRSVNTIQQVKVDGVNHGTLDPGEKIDIDLPAGQHFVETVNVKTGNYACSSFMVTIVECDTQGFSCTG